MFVGIFQWVSMPFLEERGGSGVAAFLLNSVSIFFNHDGSTFDAVQGYNAHEDCQIPRASMFDFCNWCFLWLFCQTGNESSVDRLMKQISSFMSEISDEFKIVVVDAIRSVDAVRIDLHVLVFYHRCCSHIGYASNSLFCCRQGIA